MLLRCKNQIILQQRYFIHESWHEKMCFRGFADRKDPGRYLQLLPFLFISICLFKVYNPVQLVIFLSVIVLSSKGQSHFCTGLKRQIRLH